MHDLIKDNSIVQSREFGSDTPPILSINKGEWLARVTVSPAYNATTQNRSLLKTVTATESVWTYTVTAKSQPELDAQAEQEDLDTLRQASGKDAILVLVEFVEWALANTAMTGADFTADVRQAYQDIKVLADRVK